MSKQVPAYELAETIEREMVDGFAFGYIGEAVAMLRKLQAENDAIKAKYETDYAKAFENGYAIGLSHGKDLITNGKV